MLVEQFPKILDLKFTAHMEGKLDEIASAKADMVKVLDEFYYPFQEELRSAESHTERVQIPTSEVCHVCGAPMVLKFGRTGQFLGCSKYPDCKATRPLGGAPRAEAVTSEHACPKCSKPLLIRENKRGEKFYSCSGFPACKESFNIDPQGNPVPSVVETEHVCEKCGKPMVMREGRRGKFIGCTGYPKCRNALPVDDSGRPVPPVKVEVPCPKCGGSMAVRTGRRADRSLAVSSIPSAAGRLQCRTNSRTRSPPSQRLPNLHRLMSSRPSPSRRLARIAAAPCWCAGAVADFSWDVPSIRSARVRAQPGEATLAKINELIKV